MRANPPRLTLSRHANRPGTYWWAAVSCTLLISLGVAAFSGSAPSGPGANLTTDLRTLHDLQARAKAIAKRTRPAPMVTIPAGYFVMGTAPKPEPSSALEGPNDEAEVPQRRIWLDTYRIDRDEVSFGSYVAWSLSKPRALPPDLAQLEALQELTAFADQLGDPSRPPDSVLATWPAFNVTWAEADSYCRSAGKRLPTEAEWEKAARGTKGRIFPWGQAVPDGKRAVFGRPNHDTLLPVSPVHGMDEGRSPYGLHHMAGNVAEWVQDWFYAEHYATMPERNPQGPENGFEKVARGGSWQSAAHELRTAARGSDPPAHRSPTTGFRCAKSNP